MVMTETIEKHIYVCEICGGRYGTKHEAEKCEGRGTKEPKFKVGDIVTSFANKRLFGKTGIIKDVLYSWPHPANKTETEPHITLYYIQLDLDDGEDDDLLVSENILELK